MILQHASGLLEASKIPYVTSAVHFFAGNRCVVNTNFYVSHNEVNKIIIGDSDWKLGNISDGEEFFAVCFPTK
jgi:hypothetical protein